MDWANGWQPTGASHKSSAATLSPPPHVRYAFFAEFFKNFYNTDLFLGTRVSEQAVRASWNLAAGASATASLACVPTWLEDFRGDVERVDVPTLVIHGDDDRIVPLAASGKRGSSSSMGLASWSSRETRTASPGPTPKR